MINFMHEDSSYSDFNTKENNRAYYTKNRMISVEKNATLKRMEPGEGRHLSKVDDVINNQNKW